MSDNSEVTLTRPRPTSSHLVPDEVTDPSQPPRPDLVPPYGDEDEVDEVGRAIFNHDHLVPTRRGRR